MVNPPGAAEFAAVLLAGGRAVRMDGVDKASVEHHGRTLLEHALAALVDAEEVVVVGDPVPTTRPVTFTRESPPYGGPVAALLTGLDALAGPPRTVGVLAVDMPRVTAATFRRLRAAAAGHDGAFLTDADGRRQLAGVVDRAAIEAVRPDPEAQHAMALHRLLAGLDLRDVPPEGDEGRDVDTWADLRDL
jgi:molybdopterin-guanine dinucleotide biosynthesis protein A